MEATTNHVPTQAPKTKRITKAQLQEQLAEATARAQRAEAAEVAALAAAEKAEADAAQLRAELATARTDAQALADATKPRAPEALQPAQEGIMFLWAMLNDEGYKLAFAGQDTTGKRWTMTKHSDGTRYTQTETDGAAIRCTCPAGQQYGPRCNGGRGCKHARIIRAARAMLANTGPTYRLAAAARRTPQAQIDEDSADQFAGVAR
jgi:hypothetical protein